MCPPRGDFQQLFLEGCDKRGGGNEHLTKRAGAMSIEKILSRIFQQSGVEAIESGSAEERKVRKDAKLVDLAHEAMSKQAATDSDDLNALVNIGWPNLQKEKFKNKVRKKVWDVVSEDFGAADSEMVDDITERIIDVSEADEYYRNIFDSEK
mgnify:CR=1 FL=1